MAADAVVVTGTGMPVLPGIRPLFERTGKPVLCSNNCLAWALLDELGIADLATPHQPWESFDRRLVRKVEPALGNEKLPQLLVTPETQSVIRNFSSRPAWFAKTTRNRFRP